METYLEPWRKFIDFSGRASRKEYWTFTLINAAIYIGLYMIGAMFSGPRSNESLNAADCLSGIFSLAALIPGLAVGVRRLHDTNRSGFWILVALAPCIGGIILLIFYLDSGDIGANQYGPDPYGDPFETVYSPTPPPPEAYSDLGHQAPPPAPSTRTEPGPADSADELSDADPPSRLPGDL